MRDKPTRHHGQDLTDPQMRHGLAQPLPEPFAVTFDPTHHHMLPTRNFADFRLGEVFRAPSRTMTEGVFAAFQAASGDNHPIHYDRAYL